MVLEAIGAFALACNVLQVVGYGAKVAINARSIYRSEGQDATDLEDLEGLAKQLEELNLGLGQTTDAMSTPSKTRLMVCNSESLRLSRKFITLVQSLRPNIPKSASKASWIRSFRSAIKSKWHQEELEAIQRALSQAQSNLILAVLLERS